MPDPSDFWPAQVERRVTRWAAASSLGPAWVVAVSGGGDSVALLRVLHEIAPRVGISLSVAHLDHGARGDASKADAGFVEDLARSLGLPFDLGGWKPSRPGHFESDARRARYAWLSEIARARGAKAVAVGHTRDDQSETVLHRIVRGTGVLGLAGIPARRTLCDDLTLVRPLLTVSRLDLRDYLSAIGQTYRDDASNVDTSRTRARLRHDLLPKLADEYNPRVADALVRLARLASATNRACRARVVELERAATSEATRDAVRFDRDMLLTLPIFLRAEVLRLAWRRAGWPEAGMSASRWRRIARLVRRTREGRFDVGGGIVAVTASTDFLLRASSNLPSPFDLTPSASVALEIPGSTPWPGGRGRVVLTLDPDAPRDETIDLDRLFPPLIVRAPVSGDRFNPLGMGPCETPLNDFFRARRVARNERARTPLVCDRFGIVWVVGHRISHRVRLLDSTIRSAGLRWEPELEKGVRNHS